MCELFGATFSEEVDIREYLRKFYKHSVRHPHGWGLMRRSSEGLTEIIREPVRATGSRSNSRVVEETVPQSAALAHIRLATVGAVKLANCHPFTGFDAFGRRWTMIHNGTIYSGRQLMNYLNTQSGDTDSERVFMYLMDKIRDAQRSGSLSPEQRFGIIEDLTEELSPRNKLNLIIYDGELMYVHKNMKSTLFAKALPKGHIFSTQPLDSDGWEDLPLAKVTAYSHGQKVMESSRTGSVFVPNLDYINAMAAMNI
ncbi:MAG: class II glutamine amidotransferase [Ruminococcus sp.]|nr:class II glutamine amidotransferase [Ruminococcus sp.]